MNERIISRRDILRKSLALGALAAGTAAVGSLAACSKEQKEVKCDDTTGLAPADIETRKALAYVDKTPDPNKMCQNCSQFVAGPTPVGCGTCKVLKGGAHPNGYCKSWAAKST